LRLHPTLCPLCGTGVSSDTNRIRAGDEVEDYQGRVRALREQLAALRGEAEAV